MGMFDTVTAKCPKCGQKNSDQTKFGFCLLQNFDIEDDKEVSLEAAVASENMVFVCENCKCEYKIHIKNLPTMRIEECI